MPRKCFRKYLPDHAAVREHRMLCPFQALLKHPNLWHLNRHSVAGGLAAGPVITTPICAAAGAANADD